MDGYSEGLVARSITEAIVLQRIVRRDSKDGKRSECEEAPRQVPRKLNCSKNAK